VEIPKDVYGNGHTDSECYAMLYGATKEEVAEKAEKYFAQYHPCGYGIYYAIPIQQHADGYWYCLINRWHSCD
jgi:uncharacterized membrane protein